MSSIPLIIPPDSCVHRFTGSSVISNLTRPFLKPGSTGGVALGGGCWLEIMGIPNGPTWRGKRGIARGWGPGTTCRGETTYLTKEVLDFGGIWCFRSFFWMFHNEFQHRKPVTFARFHWIPPQRHQLNHLLTYSPPHSPIQKKST